MAPVISDFPWTSKASARSSNVEYGELQRLLDAAVETEELISEGFVSGVDWRGSHPCLQGWCRFWASFLVLFLCLGSVRLWPFPFGSGFFSAPFFSRVLDPFPFSLMVATFSGFPFFRRGLSSVPACFLEVDGFQGSRIEIDARFGEDLRGIRLFLRASVGMTR